MNTQSTFIVRPFQYQGTKMQPNVLLMCKLILLLLIAHHLFFKIADPFIPFIPFLDEFHNYPNVFNYTLKALFVISSFALLFNIKVRTASIVVGLVVLINTLGSKPLFYNHSVICGCALILAGLSDKHQPPYLLIFQLSLVYFGASINKFLDYDWWSGAFMDTWLGSARKNPVYLSISKLFPDVVFAKILSFIAMFTEFSIAVMILFKKTRPLTLWFIIIFHTTLFTITSFRFGHFLESLVIILLVFRSIPESRLKIQYKTKGLQILKRFFNLLDVDKKQTWTSKQPDSRYWLSLETEGTSTYNHTALKKVFLYTPNFFMLLFVIDAILYKLLRNYSTLHFILNAIFVWSLIFYFLPINWSRIFKKSAIYKSQ